MNTDKHRFLSRQQIFDLCSSVFICGFAVLFFVAAASAGQVAEDPLERRTLDIAKDLRCAVCQNQPVAESNSDLARDMRAIIREQLQAGKTREEIIAYFVARYGDFVLLKPPYQDAGAVLWIAPLALLVVAGASAFVFLRRRLRAALPEPRGLAREDAERVRRAREEEDA